MKIAFLGDSITQGEIGASYFDMLEKRLTDLELINFGKNGDTVHSLYSRIKKVDFTEYDHIVLFIGINDIAGKLNRAHRLTRALQGQSASPSLETFILDYKKLLDHLLEMNQNIIVIPPLLLGEDLDSKWNNMVREYEVEIELIVRNYNLEYLDIQEEMYKYLKAKKQSDYLPLSLKVIARDLLTLKSDEDVDKAAEDRGLFLTLDGIHLSTKGASFVAEGIIAYLDKK